MCTFHGLTEAMIGVAGLHGQETNDAIDMLYVNQKQIFAGLDKNNSCRKKDCAW
jgi:hypothetical protein